MKNPFSQLPMLGMLAIFFIASSSLQAQNGLHFFGWDTTLGYEATDILQTQNGNLLLIGDVNSSQPLVDNPYFHNYIVNTTRNGDTIWTKTTALSTFNAGINELPNDQYRLLGTKEWITTCGNVTMTTPFIAFAYETRDANWNYVDGIITASECNNTMVDVERIPNGDLISLGYGQGQSSPLEYKVLQIDTAGTFSFASNSSNLELQIEKAPVGFWLANNTSLSRYYSNFPLQWQQTNTLIGELQDFCKVESDKLLFSYTTLDTVNSNSMRLIKKDSLGMLLWDKTFDFRGMDVTHHSGGMYIVTGVRDSSLVTMAVDYYGDSIWSMTHSFATEVRAVKSIELQNGGVATLGNVGGFGEPRRYVLALNNTVTIDEYDNASLNIVVFPNPSIGVFQLKGSVVDRWEVYDIAGKTICSGTRNTVDLSGETKGIYLLRVYSGQRLSAQKLVLK